MLTVKLFLALDEDSHGAPQPRFRRQLRVLLGDQCRGLGASAIPACRFVGDVAGDAMLERDLANVIADRREVERHHAVAQRYVRR